MNENETPQYFILIHYYIQYVASNLAKILRTATRIWKQLYPDENHAHQVH